jgi:Helix-turn-helix domain
MLMNLDDCPDLLRVGEAAAILRVSRSTAYVYANQYEATGGREGLPVIRIGNTLRVPRLALRRWIEGGVAPANGENDAA